MLAVQAELLQQVAVNRPRLLAVLEKAAADVPARQAQAAKRMRSEEFVNAYMAVRMHAGLQHSVSCSVTASWEPLGNEPRLH